MDDEDAPGLKAVPNFQVPDEVEPEDVIDRELRRLTFSLMGASLKSCEYVLSTLMQVFEDKRFAHAVKKRTLDNLITEILLWLLDERVPRMHDGSQLLKVLNVLMLRILSVEGMKVICQEFEAISTTEVSPASIEIPSGNGMEIDNSDLTFGIHPYYIKKSFMEASQGWKDEFSNSPMESFLDIWFTVDANADERKKKSVKKELFKEDKLRDKKPRQQDETNDM
ncbi:hypothetical protein Tco_1371409 [Tanacetum coccineum]